MPLASQIPLLGFVAYSGTGKTTLLEKIIPLLQSKAIRCALIKHSHHNFDIDQPGKDSYRLRKAGASEIIVASRYRWAHICESSETDQQEPDLAELITHFHPERIDLILVEGFKHESFAKIELHRNKMGKPYLYPNDSDIIALLCDEPHDVTAPIAVLDINDIHSISELIQNLIRPETTDE